jgi:5-methyltetrahydrofolate--homocysteine methyltransferase
VKKKMLSKLVHAISEMDEQDALKITEELIAQNEDPQKVLHSCSEAMDIIGKRFESGEYFLPHLMMGGEMLRKISELLKPQLGSAPVSSYLGKFLIGTVAGDIHDIGKDIVVFMLETNGFEVMDLGIDVPIDKFIESIKEFKPQVVGLSGFLTIAFDSMKETIDAIQEAGLRDQVKIVIGGGQIDKRIREFTGADAYGATAMDAVKIAQQYTS